MSIRNRVFASAALMLATILSAAPEVQAAEPKLLVKVDQIRPSKDAAGQLKACELNVSVFNRSDDDVQDASIELRWLDDAVTAVLKEEKRDSDVGQKVSDTKDLPQVILNLDIPEVKSYKQVVVPTSINSDRCFALAGRAEVTVKRCTALTTVSTEADSAARVAAAQRQKPCVMFEYVSARDPQYYKEFKKITLDEEKQQEQSKQQKVNDEMELSYQKIIATSEETANILSGIK